MRSKLSSMKESSKKMKWLKCFKTLNFFKDFPTVSEIQIESLSRRKIFHYFRLVWSLFYQIIGSIRRFSRVKGMTLKNHFLRSQGQDCGGRSKNRDLTRRRSTVPLTFGHGAQSKKKSMKVIFIMPCSESNTQLHTSSIFHQSRNYV